jgi:predicted transcriptional regulator
MLPGGIAGQLDISIITAHNYHMTQTKHRTSFALDEETIVRLRALARTWNVSQAEVVRRAVHLAYTRSESEAGEVRERIAEYRAAGRVGADEANAYLRRLQEEREDWRREP